MYRLDIAFGLFGTYLALILPYVAVTIPFNILLLTGFLRDFPEEIEQAAAIDGVGLWRMAWKVVFPLMRPVVATLAILNVVHVWNEFPFAVTLINDPALTTVSLGVSQFQGIYSVYYGARTASATLVLLPQLVIYAALQRQVIAGMTRAPSVDHHANCSSTAFGPPDALVRRAGDSRAVSRPVPRMGGPLDGVRRAGGWAHPVLGGRQRPGPPSRRNAWCRVGRSLRVVP